MVAALSGAASAFSVPLVAPRSPISSQLSATSSQSNPKATVMLGSSGSGDRLPLSRMDVLGAFGVGAMSTLALGVSAAQAKDDTALKGTKQDPEFVTCVSECVYYCTKSKEESRTRQECLPECRKSCAKTKAQGLIGAPRT
ncbi:unnamed protein product [Sphacelaria rigidula]